MSKRASANALASKTTKKSKSNDALQQKLTDVENKQANLDDFEARLAVLEYKHGADDDYDDFEARISTLETKIDAQINTTFANEQIQELDDNIKTLDLELESQQALIEQMRDEIKNLEDRISQIDNDENSLDLWNA